MSEVRPDIATMPFEAALAELEQIVDQLEKGAVALDKSIPALRTRRSLKKRCDELLKNAEMRIEKITLAADGGFKEVVPWTTTDRSWAAPRSGMIRCKRR